MVKEINFRKLNEGRKVLKCCQKCYISPSMK